MSVLMLTFVTAVGLAFLIAPRLASLTERMKTIFPNQPLILREARINDTQLAITVQNTATAEVEITQISINNKPYTITPIPIAPKQVETIYLDGSYEKGNTYTVVVVASLGKPLTVTVEYN